MEVEHAFKQMKKLIVELPTLTTPMEKEELIDYLAAAKEAAKNISKRKILADFIVERPEDDSLATTTEAEEELPKPLTLFTDESSYIDGFGDGLILPNPEGIEFTYALRFRFDTTNNEAEYEALIARLRIAGKMEKESGMIQYLEKVKTLIGSFKNFSIKRVPRSENKKADALSKIVSTSFAHLTKQVLVEELDEKSINEKEVLAVVEEEGSTWMTPIYEYLTEEILPAEKEKARAIRRKSRRYSVINGVLYKKSYLGPWLRCVGPLQANYVVREIHEGSCSMHAETRSVVAKAIRTGYYWPTMHADARKMIREFQDCKVHRPVPRNPQQKLTPIMSPWPFYKWGIDIVGPFPEGPGKCFASVKHPQANGLVERANSSLGEGIKARRDERIKDWIEEIPHVLWAHCTMIKSSNEERREQEAIRKVRSKAKKEKYYNSKVHNTSFKAGDLVTGTMMPAIHKIAGSLSLSGKDHTK
ncbi:reverse transcriptase domain-containing protein [Tanacetum coccineum]|uniref:Reverse transcriptase domain-containing protein n=1 Tax=Tanacetum coccineum TaxID=301880 RepID=A0ABQ5GGK2_9ASTR